jgi:hypothetical protein
MRVVLDTNGFVSALIAPQSIPAKILSLAREGKFALVISSKIIQEIRRVLGYPKIATRLEKHQVSTDEVEVFLERITQAAHLTPGILQVEAVQDDPADNDILACAVEGEAEFVISGDHHLTDLQSFQGIRIVDPATFLGFFERQ